MREFFSKVKKMSSTVWLIVLFVCAIVIAVSTLMLKISEKTEGQEQHDTLRQDHGELNKGQKKIENGQDHILSEIKKINSLLVKTNRAPSQEWIKIDFLNKTSAKVDCRDSEILFLQFKASAGIISGNVKIEKSDKTYPFSTHVYEENPLRVNNLFLKERRHYISYPNFSYQILDKTIASSELKIILVGVTLGGRPLKLEKPIGIKE